MADSQDPKKNSTDKGPWSFGGEGQLGSTPGESPTPQIPQAGTTLTPQGLVETVNVQAPPDLGLAEPFVNRQGQELETIPEAPIAPEEVNPVASQMMQEVYPGQEALQPPSGEARRELSLPANYPGSQANLDLLNKIGSAAERTAALQSWQATTQAMWLLGQHRPSMDIEGHGKMIVPYMDTNLWPGSVATPGADPAMPRTAEVGYVIFKGESEEDAKVRTKLMLIQLARARRGLQSAHLLQGAMLNLPRASRKLRDFEAKWSEHGFNWDEGDAQGWETIGMGVDLALSLVGGLAGRIASFSDLLFVPTAKTIGLALRPGAVRSILSPTARRLGWGTLDKLALSPTLKETIKEADRLMRMTGAWVDKEGIVHAPATALASKHGETLRATLGKFGDEIRHFDPEFKIRLAPEGETSKLDYFRNLGRGLTQTAAGGAAIQATAIGSELVNTTPEEREGILSNLGGIMEEGIRYPVLMHLATATLGRGGARLQSAVQRWKGQTPGAEIAAKALQGLHEQGLLGTTLPEGTLYSRPPYLGEAVDDISTMQRFIRDGDQPITHVPSNPPASQLRQVALPVGPDQIPDAQTLQQIRTNLGQLENTSRVGFQVAGAPDPRQGLAEANSAIMNFDSMVEDFTLKGLRPEEAVEAASQELLRRTDEWSRAYSKAYSGDNAVPWTPDPTKISVKDLADRNPHIRALALDDATAGQIVLAGWLHNGGPKDSTHSGTVPIFISDGRLVANMTEGNIPLEHAPTPETLPVPHLVDVTESLLNLRLPDYGEAWFENSTTSPVHIELTREPATHTAGLVIDPVLSMQRDLQQRSLKRMANPRMAPDEDVFDLVYDMNNTATVSETNRGQYQDRIRNLRTRLAEQWKNTSALAKSQLPSDASEAHVREAEAPIRLQLHAQEALLRHAERKAGIFHEADVDGQAIMEARKAVEAAEVPEGLVRVYRLEGSEGPPVFTTDLHGTLMRSLTEGRDIETLDVLPAAVRDGRFEGQPGKEIIDEFAVAGRPERPGLEDWGFMERNLHLLDPELQQRYYKLRQRFVTSSLGGDLFSDEMTHAEVLTDMHRELRNIERGLNAVKLMKTAEMIRAEEPWKDFPTGENPSSAAETRGNLLIYRLVRNPEELEDILHAARNNHPALGFRPASHIDGHSLSKKSSKIAQFYKKNPNGVAVFGSPLPTVAGLYKEAFDTPGIMIAVEIPKSAVIYKSSALDWQSGAGTATFCDAELIFDGTQAKKVSFLSPDQMSRVDEYIKFFESQRRSGVFARVFKDADPALVAANLIQSPDLIPVKTSLGRPFLEAPINLPNGLQVKKGMRVRLKNGATTVLNGYRDGKPRWSEGKAFEPRLEGKAYKGELPNSGYNLNIPLEDVVAVWDKEHRQWLSGDLGYSPTRKISTIAYRDRALHEDFALPEGLDPNTIKSDLDPSTRDRLGLGGNTLPAARARLWLKKGTAALESELAAKKDLEGILPALAKFPEEDRIPVQTFLNELVETGYFRGLQVRTPKNIPHPNQVGRSYPQANLIEVYLDNISRVTKLLRGQPHEEMFRPMTTLLHELWHALSYHLPEKEIADFRKLYDRALVKLSEETGLTPAIIEKQQWRGMIEPDLATEIQLLAHSTLDEFFVYQMTDRTYSHLNNVISNPVVARAKILWNALLGFIHRVVGRDKAQQVFNNFLSGYYTPLTMEQKAARGWNLSNAAVADAFATPNLHPSTEAPLLIGSKKLKRSHWQYLDPAQRAEHIKQLFWNAVKLDPAFPITEAGSKNAERVLAYLDKIEPKLKPDGTYSGGVKAIPPNYTPDSATFQALHDEWQMARDRFNEKVSTMSRLSKSPIELTPADLNEIMTTFAYSDPATLTPEQFENAVGTHIQALLKGTKGEDYIQTHPPGWHDSREAIYNTFRQMFESGEFDRLPPDLQETFKTFHRHMERMELAYDQGQHTKIMKDWNLAEKNSNSFTNAFTRVWKSMFAGLYDLERTARSIARRFTRPTSDTIMSLEMANPRTAIESIRSGRAFQDPAMLYSKAAGDFREWFLKQRNTLYPIINWLNQDKSGKLSFSIFDAADVGKHPESMKLQDIPNTPVPHDVSRAIGKPNATAADVVMWLRDEYFPSIWRAVEGPLMDKYHESAVSQRMTMKYIADTFMGRINSKQEVLAAVQEAYNEFAKTHPEFQGFGPTPADEVKLHTLLTDKKFRSALGEADKKLGTLADTYDIAFRGRERNMEKIRELQDGAGRKTNYAPHVFFETHLFPALQEMFDGDLFSFAAMLPKELRNEFLEYRAGEEGYSHDLRVALMSYIPVMGRTIFLEPAVRKVKPLIHQIPNPAKRQKLLDLGKKMLGQRDVVDMTVQADTDAMITLDRVRTLMGLPILKDIKSKPHVFRKGNILGRTAAGMGNLWFLANVDPFVLSKLNILEHMMVPYAMSNSPKQALVNMFTSWPIGMYQGTKMFTKDLFLGNHRAGQFVRKMLKLDPYISEPRALGVVDPYHDLTLNEARKIIQEQTGTGIVGGVENGMRRLWDLWYWQQVMVDSHERTVGFQTFKHQAIAAGATDTEARIYAKFNVDRIFSDHSRAGQSPYTVGGFAPYFMLIKRFMINRIDQLMTDVIGATKSVGKAQRILDGLEEQPGVGPKPLKTEPITMLQGTQKALGRELGKELHAPDSATKLPDPYWFSQEDLNILSQLKTPIAEAWLGKYPTPAAIIAARWRTGLLPLYLLAFYESAKGLGLNAPSAIPWFFSLSAPMLEWAGDAARWADPWDYMARLQEVGDVDEEARYRRVRHKILGERVFLFPGNRRTVEYKNRLAARYRRMAANGEISKADLPMFLRTLENDYGSQWFTANFMPWKMPPREEPKHTPPNLDALVRERLQEGD